MSNNKKYSFFRGQQTLAEKVSFTLSLSIVTLIVVLICYTWLTGDNEPPVLSVTKESQIRYIDQQYYVPFTVTNSGGETAESVEILATLSLPDEQRQIGRQEIDFLSPKEKRSGEFIFTRNLQEGKLEIRVASYKLP